jgi:hypothetical protein
VPEVGDNGGYIDVMRRSPGWQRLLDAIEDSGLLNLLPHWVLGLLLGIPARRHRDGRACLSHAEIRHQLGL